SGSAFAVQVDEIEHDEHQVIGATLIHRGLQAAERGHTVMTEGAQFAVEISRLHRQGTKRFDRAGIATRPVEAGAGQQLDLPAIQPGVHAIAVVLDLVQPIIARWRFVRDTGELRLDPLRWSRIFPHAGHCSTFSLLRKGKLKATTSSPRLTRVKA